MTIPFLKLQVCGDDVLLVDRSKSAELADPQLLPPLAIALLDRNRGVGASALAFIGASSVAAPPAHIEELPVRVYGPDGEERAFAADALLCAARWAADSGRAQSRNVRLATSSGAIDAAVLDSRTCSLALPQPPAPEKLTFIVDGRSISAYRFGSRNPCIVAIRAVPKPDAARIRLALRQTFPKDCAIVVRPLASDLLRFLSTDRCDRLQAAAFSGIAAILNGTCQSGVVAEWAGKGAAVRFATFTAPADKLPQAASLIERGRFWVDWREGTAPQVAGNAEYVFEGSFDYRVD